MEETPHLLPPISVLVIDDEIQMRRFLKTALPPHGYQILEAATGSAGQIEAATRAPELIILDLGLPDMDGLEVLTCLREWYFKPIVILSVRNSEKNIVAALDKGADDYLTKPFGIGELVARLRVARRHRLKDQADPILELGRLKVNFSLRRVLVDLQEIKLTATEFDVLKYLLQNRGRVLTHKQILQEIWGPKSGEQVQYLRVYIGHLRQKIEVDSNRPKIILTEPGVGYRIQEDV